MKKRQELYAGKAKSVYYTDDPDRLILQFRDDTSAFDGRKKEALSRKGMVNNKFNAFIMGKLEEAGIEINAMAGTSIGGVVAIAYASGRLHILEELAHSASSLRSKMRVGFR